LRGFTPTNNHGEEEKKIAAETPKDKNLPPLNNNLYG
jgi:hypothetical protein